MGANASVSPTEVSVAPGGGIDAEIRVRNTGDVVDEFTFISLDPAHWWISFEPSSISLLPNTEGAARVLFRPPRVHDVPAGTSKFGIRVESHEDPEGSVVEEGMVTVEPFDDRSVELIPRTSRGRLSATHDLRYDNRGNVSVNPRFEGGDSDQTLRFEFRPPATGVEPGTAQFVKARLRPVRRFWRGPAVTHPFQVLVDEEGKEPIAVDGAMLQEALLPKWFWKAVTGALALILLLAVLWFTLLKPTVKSTAKEAVAPAVEAIDERLDAAGIPTIPEAVPGETTAPAAEDGGSEAGGEDEAGGGSESTVPETTVVVDLVASSQYGEPHDFRLEVTAAPGGTLAVEEVIPSGQVFAMTDLVLQNPNGDTGLLSIARNETVLFASALENFRDLDFHFVSPFMFDGGDRVVLSVQCTTVAGPEPECADSVSFAGFVAEE